MFLFVFSLWFLFHPNPFEVEAKEVLAAQIIYRLVLIDIGTTQSPTIAVTLGRSNRNLICVAWGLNPEAFDPHPLS